MKNLNKIVYFNRKGKEGFAHLLDSEITEEEKLLFHIKLLKDRTLRVFEYLWCDKDEIDSILDRNTYGFREGDVVIINNEDGILGNRPNTEFGLITQIVEENDTISVFFKNNSTLKFKNKQDLKEHLQILYRIEDAFIF